MKSEAGTMPHSYFEWLQGFFIVHSTMDCTATLHFMYMHNHDDKYLAGPGFESDTPRLQAPVDTKNWEVVYLVCIIRE